MAELKLGRAEAKQTTHGLALAKELIFSLSF